MKEQLWCRHSPPHHPRLLVLLHKHGMGPVICQDMASPVLRKWHCRGISSRTPRLRIPASTRVMTYTLRRQISSTSQWDFPILNFYQQWTMHSQNKTWELLTCFAAIAEIKLRALCMESENSTVKKRQGLTNFSRLALNLLLSRESQQLIICLCQQAKWSAYSESRADGTSEGGKQCWAAFWKPKRIPRLQNQTGFFFYR